MFVRFARLADAANPTKYPSTNCGMVACDEAGRLLKYGQASATLSQGNVLRKMNNTGIHTNADVDVAAAADTRNVTGTGDFATTALIDANTAADTVRSTFYKGLGHKNWLWIDAGATQAQGGPIVQRVSNNEVKVYWWNSNDGKIATALTTSSDYVVENSTRWELTTAPGDLCSGVAQTAFTDEYFGFVQTYGRGLVLFDTDDSVINTADLRLIPSDTTDGYSEGTTGTATAAEVLSVIGVSLIDQTADGVVLCDFVIQFWTGPYVQNSANAYVSSNLDNAYPKWA